MKRRKEIYEKLHPETKQGTAQRIGQISNDLLSKLVKVENTPTNLGSLAKSFVQDTSDKAGLSESTIKQEIQISNNLTPEMKAQVKNSTNGKIEQEWNLPSTDKKPWVHNLHALYIL